MKKHLDWKRVGWTFGIPAIIVVCTLGVWALGNWVAGNEIEQFFVNSNPSSPPLSEYIWWFIKWITGIAVIISPIIAGLFIYLIIELVKKIINFYYHNGTELN